MESCATSQYATWTKSAWTINCCPYNGWRFVSLAAVEGRLTPLSLEHMHTYMCACMHTYLHTCIHTCISPVCMSHFACMAHGCLHMSLHLLHSHDVVAPGNGSFLLVSLCALCRVLVLLAIGLNIWSVTLRSRQKVARMPQTEHQAMKYWLMVSNMFYFLYCSIIYGIILPIDFHNFQDGYCTTNQSCFARWSEKDSFRA